MPNKMKKGVDNVPQKKPRPIPARNVKKAMADGWEIGARFATIRSTAPDFKLKLPTHEASKSAPHGRKACRIHSGFRFLKFIS